MKNLVWTWYIFKKKPATSPTTAEPSTQRQKKHYYSLKNHREGPNTEGGEVDTQQNQKGVKAHNKDVESRHRIVEK
jgi:hypothetical protein